MGPDLRAELARQVANLRRLGYPDLAVAALEARLDGILPSGVEGRIPLVVVVRSDVVPTAEAVSRVELDGKPAFTDMDDLERFATIDGIDVPDGLVYLVTDVDAGAGTLNVTPDDALESIAAAGRSPLTIDEGVALVTHFPELLRTANAFSILGSRCGDRRVTALWLSKGRPRLGWCWAGNPHTWLGSASCAGRLGAGASRRRSERARAAS